MCVCVEVLRRFVCENVKQHVSQSGRLSSQSVDWSISLVCRLADHSVWLVSLVGSVGRSVGQSIGRSVRSVDWSISRFGRSVIQSVQSG